MRRNHLAAAAGTALALSVLTSPAHAAPLDSLSENFDDITTLNGAGWSQQNLSSPVGSTNWFQGNNTVFNSQAGATNAYIGANFNNVAGTGTISNWLLTPELALTKGSRLTFWTRSAFAAGYGDRLQVRLSTSGASTDLGATPESVGVFDTLESDINPDLVDTGYPTVWTQYTVTVGDVPAGATGRIGFRYFVTNGGPTGSDSNYIGIDTVNFQSAPAVTSISPSSGRLSGGTRVTLTGSFFTGADTATINGVPCTSLVVESPTTITCTTGAGTAGTGTAEVTTLSGITGSGGTFTYGTPGPLQFTPTPADFGSVTQGKSATKTVTVRNTGSIPVTPSAITATPSQVTVLAGAGRCAPNTAIPAGGQCDVALNWSPTSTGALSGGLTIAHPDGTTASSTLQVTGTAVPKKPAAPGKPKVKTSAKKVKASWKKAARATDYKVVVTGKRASAKSSTSAADARLSATTSKSKVVKKPKVSFKVALKSGSKAKVCVTARNAGGSSKKVCATKKVP